MLAQLNYVIIISNRLSPTQIEFIHPSIHERGELNHQDRKRISTCLPSMNDEEVEKERNMKARVQLIARPNPTANQRLTETALLLASPVHPLFSTSLGS
jgi:hypothetical protein